MCDCVEKAAVNPMAIDKADSDDEKCRGSFDDDSSNEDLDGRQC